MTRRASAVGGDVAVRRRGRARPARRAARPARRARPPGRCSSTRSALADLAAGVERSLAERRRTRSCPPPVPGRRGRQDGRGRRRPAGRCSGTPASPAPTPSSALGGGATTDLAGFVAATWLRGVRVVHVPTTLLGMVDAAVGGKTGINTAEGKNLVGAFHPPAGVLCDLDDARRRCPRADLVSGLAEVVKAASSPTRRILELVEADPAARAGPDGPRTARAGRARRPGQGRRRRRRPARGRGGWREILNYGHTFGHAIEQVEQLPLAPRRRRVGRHGLRRRAGPRWPAASTTTRSSPAPRACSTRVGLPTTLRAAAAGRSCSTPCASTRRPAATGCGSSCSTTSGSPGRARGARPRPARAPPIAKVAAVTRVLVLNGPNLGRLGSPRARGLRPRDLRRPGRAAASTAGAELGLDGRGPADRRRGRAGRLAARGGRRADCPSCSTRPRSRTTRTRCATPARMRTAPLVEVHLSNPAAREEFRHTSVVARSPTAPSPASASSPTSSRCAPWPGSSEPARA